MPDEVITLWRYRDLPEALAAWAKLQSAGIECSLADKEIIRLDWFWSNAFGGVRLQLNSTDAEDALAVLADPIPESFAAEDVGQEYRQPVCPNCGSLDVGFEALHRGVALAALKFIALPVPIPIYRWKCVDCGRSWKGEYV
jgi:hypothetical protein